MPRCKPCTTPACTSHPSPQQLNLYPPPRPPLPTGLATAAPAPHVPPASAQPADPRRIAGAAHHQPALGRAPGPAAAACLGCDPAMLLDATQNMLPEQAPV